MANKFHIRGDGVILDGFTTKVGYPHLLTYDTASGDVGYFTGSAYGGGSGTSVLYVTSSGNTSLTGIEVADYSNDVAVTFTGGTLKFIFGVPVSQSITDFTFNGTFATDRFNKELDPYTATATWANNGYTLVSASIFEGSTRLTNIGTGTTLAYSTTTSGSHTYILYVTASSPLDNSLKVVSTTLPGNLYKILPGPPYQSLSPSIQLGTANDEIEQGATGSIIVTASSGSAGSANRWTITSFSTTGSFPGADYPRDTLVNLFGNTDGTERTATLYVTGSATGSIDTPYSSYVIINTYGYYNSGPLSLNDPLRTEVVNTQLKLKKIRSLRGGASSEDSFRYPDLEKIDSWDTTIGGSIGTIYKGILNPSGQSVTITWTGDKYLYIVYDAAHGPLTDIRIGGTSVLGNLATFTNPPTQITCPDNGQPYYIVYRSNYVQAGGPGTTIIYNLI